MSSDPTCGMTVHPFRANCMLPPGHDGPHSIARLFEAPATERAEGEKVEPREILARALYENWCDGRRIDPTPDMPFGHTATGDSIWHFEADELLRSLEVEPVAWQVGTRLHEGGTSRILWGETYPTEEEARSVSQIVRPLFTSPPAAVGPDPHALEEAALALMQAKGGPGEPMRETARIAVEAYLRALSPQEEA